MTPSTPRSARQGLWRRFGDKVLERPLGAWSRRCSCFVGGALGLAAYKVDYSTTNFFKQSVESVEGFEVLGESFPKGTLAPTTVLVERSDGPVTRRRRERGGGQARSPWTASPGQPRPASGPKTARSPRST